MLNPGMMSTGKDDWETPDDLFQTYNRLFNFKLDAAANQFNHKCEQWFGPGSVLSEDALTTSWLVSGYVWLNPPYSRGLQAKFVKKAVEEVKAGNCWGVICLLPARTDTKLFHEIILPNGDVTFLKGRVKFVGAEQGAPFPSMIVVFK